MTRETEKNNLVVLLGAGFSVPAGLPLAYDINERFNRDQKEKLLLMSSSEWKWIDDKDKTMTNNGKLNYDYLAYSYILNEIVNTYNRDVNDFDNYEVFFSYVLEKFDHLDWFKSVYERARKELVNDKPFLVNGPEPDSIHLSPFTRDPQISKIEDIFNYLIEDMLYVSIETVDNSISKYEKFIDYILKFDRVDIYTLNHDLLLEKLLDKKGVSYCRGFSSCDSDIAYESKKLQVFNNCFEDKINIHKLHGSVDFFRFKHFENNGGGVWKPTEKYNYFTTTEYREKHEAVRVNLDTGETEQDMNFDIVPKFITGTKKTSIISNDTMYLRLFENFKCNISSASKVLISGYSYGDEHINKELIERNNLNVINQNPNKKYPFEGNITDIDNLHNLPPVSSL